LAPEENNADVVDQTPEDIGKEEGKCFVDAFVDKQSNKDGFAKKTGKCERRIQIVLRLLS
jgi:hypothetical protein